MGLLDQFKAYIQANTPRSTTPRVSPGKVINEGLLNPNQYNAPAANRFKDSLFGMTGIVPGVGDVASGVQAADFWNRGEKLNAGLSALGALPFIPTLHTVYHGSPHKFNKFDMSKIGTGEGAQAYGHGLYMAESPEVAKTYSKAGNAFTPTVKDLIDNVTREGNLYKVDIPDESIPRMLDWDKPLSQQHPDVQKALASDPRANDKFYDNGAEYYRALMARNRGDAPLHLSEDKAEDWAFPIASKQLQDLGIPGIRYLDGSSRNVGEGTSNFVLFDDQLPRILEINGQPTGLLSYADEAKKTKGLISEPLSMRQSTELGDVTLTESAKNPGQYQLTMWDGKLGQSKPVRDEQFKSKDEAIKAYKAMIGEK